MFVTSASSPRICVGAATNIIYGLALGMKSAILPIFLIAGTVFMSFELVGMYGVAMAALGMLGTLATCLSIDVYGPVCDNAGGIAEMSEFPESVRDKTDALDAAGNTTAAIGKGMLATPSTCAFRSEGCDAKSCGQIGQENAQFF